MTPGPWLRLLALASTAGVAAVVATGEWGLAHDVVANITLVLLAAVVLCARFAHRNRRTLLVASGSAFGLFALAGLSALAGAPTAVHLTLGAAALVASAVAAAVCARGGEPVPRAAWRDYLTLTKPRIMVLLLLTAAGGMFVGAEGVPPAGLFVAHDGGPRARLRWRQRAEPRPRPRHRRAHAAHRQASCRDGPRARGARPRVRPRALRSLLRRPRELRERARGGPRARRRPLLRPRLHPLAQALDAAEHRHRRRCRRRPSARRLGRGDGEPDAAGALALPDRVLLDAAPLLGARAPHPARLRGGARPDAARW